MANQDSFHLKCREAKHSDYNAVMKIASVETVRDGFDYLPAKFHQWVDDPEAYVLVAEADNKVIAVYVCYMTDGGAYLFHKSIRIAPKLQGKKLLTRIGFELEKALQLRLHPRLLHLERHAIADVKRLYLLKGMNRKDICVIASIHLFTVSHVLH
ncbi:probable N-acetyltransferase 16 [Branchiostoma floridae]|uniref:Probable N-acetyltransferase 16 n=1 Tax=Branchiostoma floridae TaxID=7739 RepID=A0A9J7NA48_BRAFL|nr:probable N-acetyltransferase 16 [Branchiostoma floridae]